jgi:hypothetical protein
MLDVGAMIAAAKRLVGALSIAEQCLPFPLADSHAPWPLDRQDAPFALLGTALPDAALDTGSSRERDAGRAALRVAALDRARGARGATGAAGVIASRPSKVA